MHVYVQSRLVRDQLYTASPCPMDGRGMRTIIYEQLRVYEGRTWHLHSVGEVR